MVPEMPNNETEKTTETTDGGIEISDPSKLVDAKKINQDAIQDRESSGIAADAIKEELKNKDEFINPQEVDIILHGSSNERIGESTAWVQKIDDVFFVGADKDALIENIKNHNSSFGTYLNREGLHVKKNDLSPRQGNNYSVIDKRKNKKPAELKKSFGEKIKSFGEKIFR